MKPQEAIDVLFERLLFAKYTNRFKFHYGREHINLSSFDDISVLGVPGLDVNPGGILLFEAGDGDRRPFTFPPDAMWPFDYQSVSQAHSDWQSGSLQVTRVSSIDIKEARKLGAAKFSRYMVKSKIAVLKPDGTYDFGLLLQSYLGNRWIDAAPPFKLGRAKGNNYAPRSDRTTGPDDDTRMVAIAQSAALSERYEWSVTVGFDDGPKIRLHSDPAGLRAMFRDRDKPADRDRRSPLRHWVREHWRRKRNDPSALSYIIDHLRGRTPFSWYGYDCTINPSAYEMEQLAKREARSAA